MKRLILVIVLALTGCTQQQSSQDVKLLNKYRAATAAMIIREVQYQREIRELEQLFTRCLERLDNKW